MLLIRSVKIIDARSPYNGQTKDILVEKGVITRIDDRIEAINTEILTGENWHISPGWVDMRVSAHDPGHEHKEDLTTTCEAAMAGGFTEIVMQFQEVGE